jgi:hypothetical protein
MLQIIERSVIVPERAKNRTSGVAFMRPHRRLNTLWPVRLEEYLRLWAHTEFTISLVFHHNFAEVMHNGVTSWFA